MFPELPPKRFIQYVQWTSPEKALMVEEFVREYAATHPYGKLALGIFLEGETYQETGVEIIDGIPKRHTATVAVPAGLVAVQVTSILPKNQSERFRTRLGEIFNRRISPPKGGSV